MENKLFFWTNYYKEHPEEGTTPKILSEIETLREMGFKVSYTAYLDDGVAIFDESDKMVSFQKYYLKNIKVLSATRKDYLVSIARKYIKKNRFDYFLLRINYIGQKYYHMLKEMKGQNAFVMMESLSYYPNMDFGNIKKASYMMIAGSLKKHRSDLKYVVDLMLTEGILDDFYGIPCVEFGMGVDVKKYQKHMYKGDSNKLNLLMVGCDSVYHGTDRIVKSVENYVKSGKTNIQLHLVGNILEKDKQLIESCKLDDYIVCYGKQYGSKLDEIYNQCNIALGPLAQHRIQKKDTGLKTKEYFARGIPYIYTGSEVRIKDDYPYIMKINDTEDLIDLNNVYQFYKGIEDYGMISDKMREKAVSVFSWKEIFKDVFRKVREVRSL